ncbi:MAG: MarC family protein [Desulfuromonadales bacterium]|nr:MarC family protein [Desulfuromonadales bacterium]
MKSFWICFVSLFVAVDAAGILPMFLGLTGGLEPKQIKTVILHSVSSATLVALAFLFAGPSLLGFLGITIPDFMIAGGILLLAISLSDLLSGEKKLRQVDPNSLGAVPLGVPLITGPAVLTACLLLANTYGRLLAAAALIVNVSLVGVLFLLARPISDRVGRTGTMMISKVASLLLAAFAVMLMRRGIIEIWLSVSS